MKGSLRENTVGFIFARGGSKGVARKNLRLLAGRPLIVHAIIAAKSVSAITRVVVSTDDDEIAQVARAAGAEVPFMRPPALAADDAPELLSWKHALRTLAESGQDDVTTFVSIPATAPLRRVEDIVRCIDLLWSRDADLALTVFQSNANPHFNLVIERDGWFESAAQTVFYRRQDAPRIMQITPIAYAARPDYVLATNRLLDGRIAAHEVPPERALDIDSEYDLRLAELLMEEVSRGPGR